MSKRPCVDCDDGHCIMNCGYVALEVREPPCPECGQPYAPSLNAAAPELLAALKAMVNRWEPDTAGADRRMWEDACEAIRKAEALRASVRQTTDRSAT